jgi:hypothetical protein
MADPALHRAAGAPKHVAIGLEKYVSIFKTAKALGLTDSLPHRQMVPTSSQAARISSTPVKFQV